VNKLKIASVLVIALVAAVAVAAALASTRSSQAAGAADTVQPGTAGRAIGQLTVGGIAGTMDVRSFNWGLTAPASAGAAGAGAGKVTFDSFTVVKSADEASPALFLAAAKGLHFASVKISLAGGKYVLTLTDATIVGLHPGQLGAPNDTLLEEVSFMGAKIQLEAQTPKGTTTKVVWDRIANKQL
jgi:type VI secretion system secreted protein Hcp